MNGTSFSSGGWFATVCRVAGTLVFAGWFGVGVYCGWLHYTQPPKAVDERREEGSSFTPGGDEVLARLGLAVGRAKQALESHGADRRAALGEELRHLKYGLRRINIGMVDDREEQAGLLALRRDLLTLLARARVDVLAGDREPTPSEFERQRQAAASGLEAYVRRLRDFAEAHGILADELGDEFAAGVIFGVGPKRQDGEGRAGGAQAQVPSR